MPFVDRESECGSEVEEYVKKEKQRKQMEAVAEDLFNSKKVWLNYCVHDLAILACVHALFIC